MQEKNGTDALHFKSEKEGGKKNNWVIYCNYLSSIQQFVTYSILIRYVLHTV